jgi:flagellar M-ring protein FliF
LNKSLAQLSELFRSMTPGARITAGLLLAVVVVSLGYLFRQSTTGPDAFLFGGQALSDGELNRIEAALGRANVTWVRENNRVRVPSGQQTTALGAIADADALPMNFNTILEDSLG